MHQAAVELGQQELAPLIADPQRPVPLGEAWRLLPGARERRPGGSDATGATAVAAVRRIAGDPRRLGVSRHSSRAASGCIDRRDKTRPMNRCSPIKRSGADLATDQLTYPRTGLPENPYALRPHHLDTAHGVLDAALESIDRRLSGALTRGQRPRREPVPVGACGRVRRGGRLTKAESRGFGVATADWGRGTDPRHPCSVCPPID